MCFSENFSELLRSRHISPQELSATVGISENMIYFLLRGKRKPSLTVAIIIAEVLQVKAEDLLTGEEIREAPAGEIVKLNASQKNYLKKLLAKYNRSITPIKELRGRSGLSQENFASKYGISLRILRIWEIGRESPSPQLLADLSEAVNKDFPLPKDHLNGHAKTAWKEKMNITFDRKELFVLEVVKNLNRAEAFVLVQKLIRREPNQDMFNAKQSILLKLAAMTDRDYRSINTKKCFEGWYGVPSPDGFCDFEIELRGIMSEDGEILREPLPGESEMIKTELKIMGIPPCSDDWLNS